MTTVVVKLLTPSVAVMVKCCRRIQARVIYVNNMKMQWYALQVTDK